MGRCIVGGGHCRSKVEARGLTRLELKDISPSVSPCSKIRFNGIAEQDVGLND